MTKIVDLKGKAFSPKKGDEEKKVVVNDYLVEGLKQMLKEAEEGLLQEFCGSGITSDGLVYDAILDTGADVEKMFGALTHLGLYYRDLRINPFTAHLVNELFDIEE